MRPSLYLMGYIIFLSLYFVPLAFQETSLELDERAVSLIYQALAINSVQQDIILNVLGNLLLTALFYFLLAHLIHTIGKTLHISKLLLTLISAVWSWLLLCYINMQLFPNSLYIPPLPDVSSYVIVGCSVFIILFYITLSVRQFRQSRLSTGIVVFAGGLFYIIGTLPAASKTEPQQRNVILIGVDSFSTAALEITGHLLPNISALSAASVQFKHAYTPIGRTFPAWTSILSGNPPALHGAYFNLRDMDFVDRQNLLTRDLKDLGYRTIFAIDERRFCNIDESFGFDRVIGPDAGILDFLIQRYNDTPLTNLALQFKIFSPFFAYSRMNVASHTNYNPDAFINAISSELDNEQPLFLAVHLESAHFPFKTSRTYPQLDHANRFLVKQSNALQLVDHQIGLLLHQLKSYGVLDSAIVILLSDHGEGLGENEIIHGTQQDTIIATYGHGTNILSDWQNRIILSAAEFEGGKIKTTPSTIDRNVSLLNIRDWVQKYVSTGKADYHHENNQCFPVETGLRFFAAENYETIDHKKLAAEGLPYYSVTKTGRMVLREDKLKSLIETKDIGVWCGNNLTLFNRKENRIYTLTREADGLTEIETDSHSLRELKKYIAQYQSALSSLKD